MKLKWEPGLNRLTWPGSSVATLFSGNNTGGMRGLSIKSRGALQVVEMLLCNRPSRAAARAAIGQLLSRRRRGQRRLAGRDGNLAWLTEGEWRSVIPVEAMQLVEKASGPIAAHRSGGWESGIVWARELQANGQAVVRQRQPAIADPNGGAATDAQC